MTTYRYSIYDEDTPETSEDTESEKGWLFRDPLRGLSIDKFPYPRKEGELKLDFVFKGMMYGPMIGISVLMNSPWLFLWLALWVGVNFLRRNS